MSEDPEFGESRRAALRGWCKSLERAAQDDGWGQVVEAVEAYEQLGQKIMNTLDALDPPSSDRAFINKTLVCLNLRSRVLAATEDVEGPSVEQIQSILGVLKTLFRGPTPPFPVDLKEFGSVSMDMSMESKPTPGRGGEAIVGEGGEAAAASSVGTGRGGTLLPCPRLISGRQYLSFDIEKIGLKDAETYVDPFFTISVYDRDGVELGIPQDTPVSNRKADFHVFFASRVFIQTPVEELRTANAAVFFEFKHYKPREKYVSVRCWSLVEMDEVKEGLTMLEIYKKPIDPHRKKIKAHSVKPLYLHVRMALHSL